MLGMSKRAFGMQNRRDQILQAAVELFSAQGYLGTTVDEIAMRAKVTKRTVYHHMGSKEHILFEIHSNFVSEGLAKLLAVAEDGGSVIEQLRNLIRAHIQTTTDHLKEIGVFFEEIKHLNEIDRVEITTQRSEYESIVQNLITKGIETGEIRDMDARVATMVLLGGLTEIYRWYHVSDSVSTYTLTNLLTDIVLDGVRI